MLDVPIFTLPLDLEIAGDDPLGLAPTNERLYSAVFPGINNVVRYIRVYSAICWIVNRIDQYLKAHTGNLTKPEAKRISDEATQKLQLALAWVNQGKGYTQIAGIGRVFPIDDSPVKLVFESFGNSRVSLLDAVAYRPSLTNGLGFLEPRDNGTFACTKAGEALAKAFDNHARSSAQYEWLADVLALETRRSYVFNLEDVLDVGSPTEAEQTAFLHQFFPSAEQVDLDKLTQNRWFGLHLMLHSVHSICKDNRAIGLPARATEHEIRACMARGLTSRGNPLRLDTLATVQAWWAVLQLRQLQRLALDVLYCVVERWLNEQNIVGAVTSIDACSQRIGASVLDGLEADYRPSISVLINNFHKEQADEDSLYAAFCSTEPNSQLDAFNHINELMNVDMAFDESGNNPAVTSSYVALVFCATEALNLYKKSETKEVLLRDRDSCSLMSLMSLIDRMKSSSPDSLVAHLVKFWVLLRHFSVVAERSQHGDDKNRFRFVVGDHGLERFNPMIALPSPAVAQDRLQHTLLLCHQSGLLDEKAGHYKLTTFGRERLKEAN